MPWRGRRAPVSPSTSRRDPLSTGAGGHGVLLSRDSCWVVISSRRGLVPAGQAVRAQGTFFRLPSRGWPTPNSKVGAHFAQTALAGDSTWDRPSSRPLLHFSQFPVEEVHVQ